MRKCLASVLSTKTHEEAVVAQIKAHDFPGLSWSTLEITARPDTQNKLLPFYSQTMGREYSVPHTASLKKLQPWSKHLTACKASLALANLTTADSLKKK